MRDKSFRRSPAPAMQAGFFGVTLVPAGLCVLAVLIGPEFLGGEFVGTTAGLAALCLLANGPWLVVCHLMRRRHVRRLEWLAAGCCAGCGYDLSATAAEARCPECGREGRECREQAERAAARW